MYTLADIKWNYKKSRFIYEQRQLSKKKIETKNSYFFI